MQHFHLAFAAVSLALVSAAPARSDVVYRVTPEVDDGRLQDLEVEARFPADASGRTLLELPDHGGADKDWWRLLSDLQVDNAAVQLRSPAERVLLSKPGATITVRYRVSSGYDHDPTVADGNPYRPIIRPTWFQVMGERIFVVPKGREKAKVTFSWGTLPSGWTAASDLEHATVQTVDSAQSSLLIGGADVRVIERRTSSGGLLRLAYRGDWAFAPEALADKIAEVGIVEDRFWREGGKPYLVSLIPLTPLPTGHSSGGRGLSEAFALFEEPTVTLDRFPFLLAHERMHTWIPFGLGGLPDEKEALDYWFSEGFTDFYATRLLLRSGVWSLDDFVSRANEMLARYWQSGARNAPDARIQEGFWSDGVVQQLPYDRGWLLATLWDNRLRRSSGGRVNLDAAMLKQRALALQNDAGGVTIKAAQLFPTAYRLAGGGDLSSDLTKYVEGGATVELPADLYGACAAVATEHFAAFDRGFDGAKSAETGVITGVEPDGPAYAAGLRDGMKRLGREGIVDGDSRVEIGYRVIDDKGSERVIRFHPAGKLQVTLQQVRVAPGLSPSQLAACTRLVSGGL
jgi:predicted metalloprotease with PDZ domain